MDILAYLRDKYPHQAKNIKYMPLRDCNRCGGDGEARTKNGDLYVCVCTCVQNWSNEFSNVVSEAAKKGLREMFGEEQP